MAFNHRKMLVSYLPRNDFNLTIFIPCSQTYPPPLPPPPQQRDLSQLVSILMYVVGSILLFPFLVVLLYLYITQPRRSSASEVAPSNLREEEEEEAAGQRDYSTGDHHVWRITTLGLHRSAIDSITVVGFKKGQGIIDGTECSVCLNEFEEDESLRLLPKCSHAFHIDCIDTWLLSHKNCPLCRAPILLLTEPRRQETETNHHHHHHHHHQADSGLSNDLNGEGESSGSRNRSVLSRAQSDLANHCGSENVETVRRSFSIGGSSSLKACDGDETATTSRRHFYTSFSANFFSSSRRLRNQDSTI